MQHLYVKRFVTLLPELYSKENQDWYTPVNKLGQIHSNSCSIMEHGHVLLESQHRLLPDPDEVFILQDAWQLTSLFIHQQCPERLQRRLSYVYTINTLRHQSQPCPLSC